MLLELLGAALLVEDYLRITLNKIKSITEHHETCKYKTKLVEKFQRSDVIDKSLDRVIQSENGNYIMQAIRDEYLKDSTVTIRRDWNHRIE